MEIVHDNGRKITVSDNVARALVRRNGGWRFAEPEAEQPPRSGAGSGRDAWVAYADTVGVEVTDDMSRDDIIAAVDG